MKWLAAILLIVILAGCSSTGSDLVPGTPVRGGVSATQIITMTPNPLPTSTRTQALTPVPEGSLIAQVEGTPVVIAPTRVPTQPAAIQVCSPLTIHPLEELPEIISDPYRPPPPGKEQRHHGVDFSYYRRGERLSIQGVGVQAVLEGVVAASLVDTFPYGNLVIIETPFASLPAEWVEFLHVPPGGSIYTLYAHLEGAPEVIPGQDVDACQLLGTVGLSGNAAEPHLHIEMRTGPVGVRFNSMGFYKADDTA